MWLVQAGTAVLGTYGMSNHVHVDVHVVGLYLLVDAGAASLQDDRACLWDTEYCNTSALSDLGWFVVSRRFLGIPMLLGLFRDVWLMQGGEQTS